MVRGLDPCCSRGSLGPFGGKPSLCSGVRGGCSCGRGPWLRRPRQGCAVGQLPCVEGGHTRASGSLRGGGSCPACAHVTALPASWEGLFQSGLLGGSGGQASSTSLRSGPGACSEPEGRLALRGAAPGAHGCRAALPRALPGRRPGTAGAINNLGTWTRGPGRSALLSVCLPSACE